MNERQYAIQSGEDLERGVELAQIEIKRVTRLAATGLENLRKRIREYADTQDAICQEIFGQSGVHSDEQILARIHELVYAEALLKDTTRAGYKTP